MNKKKDRKVENLNENKNIVTPEVVESEIEKTFVEDPLFRFIKKWQGVICWAIIILIGCYYANQKFTEVRENSKHDAADSFANLRSQYANIITLNKDIKEMQLEIDGSQKEMKEDKKIEGKKKDLEDLKKQLEESYKISDESIKILSSDRDYDTVTILYSALLDKSKNDIEGFKSKIGKSNYQTFAKEKDDKARFYKELSAIIMAKYYFENGTQDGEAKDLLTQLAKDGIYFNVVAFKTLESLSTGDDAQALDKLKEELKVKYPEQTF